MQNGNAGDLKVFCVFFLNRGFNVKPKTVPYIHEAKSSDIWGVSVSYQSHQLFPGQLKSKQFVKKTEGSGHDATGPNSSHLQRYQRHTPKSIISRYRPK